MTDPTWFASFYCEDNPNVWELRRVTIEHVKYTDWPWRFAYVSHGALRVGLFPGVHSNEWIEYIP